MTPLAEGDQLIEHGPARAAAGSAGRCRHRGRGRSQCLPELLRDLGSAIARFVDLAADGSARPASTSMAPPRHFPRRGTARSPRRGPCRAEPGPAAGRGHRQRTRACPASPRPHYAPTGPGRGSVSYSGATLRYEGPDVDSARMSEYPLKSRKTPNTARYKAYPHFGAYLDSGVSVDGRPRYGGCMHADRRA